jgi:energy-coupling factor transporter ATP-binding protein EcfA2
LGKQLIEKNPTVGDYVRNPEILYKNLLAIREEYNKRVLKSSAKLHRPFDYLSCEQIGDSFELLQTLYSNNFPGYDDLLERTNTILTGPRGCGKSTIFRNLSYKTQLLAGKNGSPNQFVGIYYNCNDLYYAFPYTISHLDELARKAITHYFNLAMLAEILGTFAIFEEKFEKLPDSFYDKLQGFLGAWFKTHERPPSGLSLLGNLLSQIIGEKEKFRAQIAENGINFQPSAPLPQDFLQRLCGMMQTSIPWLTAIPFYFFLDDYSIPRVSKEIQMTLNCFVLTRYSELFFKISTESIVSIYPFDATGKMLEQTREYDVIDLGDYFLFSDNQKRSTFLREIINNRLQNAAEFDWENKDITKILGNSPYSSSNELARAIKKGEHVQYAGWDTVVELCSGDIANILRLTRDMFTQSEGQRCDIPKEVQNKVIRETGNDFLNKIESIQDTGRQLRKIVQAFGEVANYYLKTRTSKNVNQEPQKQASRIEVRETIYFEGDEKQGKLREISTNAKKNYEDLIKYGVFIQDVRGKSIRGAVVPRLYLRRLLIPTFVLTPSKRDSISLEAYEFILLLSNPEEFVKHMKSKRPRRKSGASVASKKGQKRF